MTRAARSNPLSTFSHQRGFTLIEMMIVLVIGGVLLALGIPRLDAARYRADSTAQLVRMTLQTALRTALTRQHDVIVSFDTTARKIRVIWDADNNGTMGEGERVTWVALETGNRFTQPATGLSGTVTGAIIGPALRTMDGMPTLTFHRDGSASTTADIYVTSPGQGTAFVFRAIRLIQPTGRTEWYRQSASGAWIRASL